MTCSLRRRFGQLMRNALVIAMMQISTSVVYAMDAPPRTIEDITRTIERYASGPDRPERPRGPVDREPPAGLSGEALGQFYAHRGADRMALGRVGAGLADFRLALGAVRGSYRSGPGPGAGFDEYAAYTQLSEAEVRGGNFASALRMREELLSSLGAQRFARPGLEASSHAAIAGIAAQMGDVRAASVSLERARQLLTQTQARFPEVARTRLNRLIQIATGEREFANGQFGAAAQTFGKIRDSVTEERSGPRAQGTLAGLPDRVVGLRQVEALIMQGELSQAELLVRTILTYRLRQDGRDSLSVAKALTALGRVLSERGRYREAAEVVQAGSGILHRIEAPPESVHLAESRKVLGAALVAQGRYRDALPAYEAMQAGLARDSLLLQKFGVGDIDWGYALLVTGEAQKAIAMLGQLAEETRKRLGDADYRVAELRGHLALARAKAGDRAGALSEFAVSVPVLLDQARHNRGTEEGFGPARTARLVRVLEGYIGLLTEGVPSPEALGEAFRVADVARSGQVQRALAASSARASIPDPVLADLARREQDAQNRIGVLSDLLNRLLSAPPDQQLPKVTADLRNTISELRAERAKLTAEIHKRFPEYANLLDPKPPTMGDVHAALKPGETLLSIYPGVDRTYVWAIPKVGTPVFVIAAIGEPVLADMVARLRAALDSGATTFAQVPRFDVALAGELYDKLLRPVEATLKGADNILVVTIGALAQLPFGLLPTAATGDSAESGTFEQYKAVPWLIRKAAITQVPSVNSLVTLRKVPPGDPARRAFAGFGDPYFNRQQQAEVAPPAPMQMASLSVRNLTVRRVVAAPQAVDTKGDERVPPAKDPAPSIANSSRIVHLMRLPETGDEIREIASALGADAAQDVFLNDRATESRVKSADLANRRVIAFATHGLVPGDLDGLTQPALALAAPEVTGEDGDGLLTMDEILTLKLNADWVVLSACNTAAGEGTTGSEAFSGLGRAFFFAGARALLVSNWPVETTSARMLTVDLFRRQRLDPGLNRAQALREAMLALMNGRSEGAGGISLAHPMFWAPFSLVGDGG